ncbi:MAG: carboxy methyl transferase for protein phosphatase 2A [Piccolia ochrophora]|nr:MAG: carboxy methyl transferase for protein phosphatase 2A [Piccolia ochrophora]
MTAPSIPNLTTLRAAQPNPSARGRGRGRGQPASDSPSTSLDDEQAKDKIVQHTDQDASLSRLSAVEVGYLVDPFAKDFITEPSQRRFPIINRGTYVRSTAIDTLVDKFLATPPLQKKQIISLGAGSDTRYFRLICSNPDLNLLYHELDFPTNTCQKITAIKRFTSSRLPQAIDFRVSNDGNALYSPTYNIHPIDLRTLRPPNDGEASPSPLPNLDPTLPTMLLSECCLIYLSPPNADAILKYFSSHLFPPSTPLGLVIYEPVNPNDSFGRVMVRNLANRGIVLQTLRKYASLGRQRERLRVMGFANGQGSADVDFIWEDWITSEEKERVAKLEMLDEVEEWRMLAQHYCVAWGWRDGTGQGGELVFQRWKDEIEKQSCDE